MTIEEAVNIFIDVSVCTKHRATCNKKCSTCCVFVPDQKMIEACNMALDALYICKTTEPYRIQVDKAS